MIMNHIWLDHISTCVVSDLDTDPLIGSRIVNYCTVCHSISVTFVHLQKIILPTEVANIKKQHRNFLLKQFLRNTDSFFILFCFYNCISSLCSSKMTSGRIFYRQNHSHIQSYCWKIQIKNRAHFYL